MRRLLNCLLFGGCWLAAYTAPALAAEDLADLWRGKQITLMIGYGPGGGYDDYARLIARYLGHYLPGNPSIVVESRPGAGSIKLANELFGTLPADGSVLGMIGDVLLVKQVLGGAEINFIARRFNWIGRLGTSDPVLVVRPQTGITGVAEAKTREIDIGVPGAGSATGQTILVLDNLIGTKFKLISGYRSSTEVRLAVERGEVDGSGSVLWSLNQDWIRRNKLTILYQVAAEKMPDLQSVPRLTDLGQTEDQQQLLRFFGSYVEMGRSILVPPAVPPQVVAALRAGFMRMAADPMLLEDARQEHVQLSIESGEALQKAAEEISNLPDRLRAEAVAISNTVADAK